MKRSEKSAEAVLAAGETGGEGPNRRKSKGNDAPQGHKASDVRATGTPIGR